jgi:predicted outer membrane repeat protein
MAGVAQAAPVTYTVGTADDSSTGGDCSSDPNNSNCSLREAIDEANGTADADTILFNSNLTGSTIQLTTGALEISQPVAIDAGATGATIDGGQNDRVFYLQMITEYDPVSISGLVLRNGIGSYNSQDNGGVVDNESADLTISDAVITGGYTTDIGGGIYSREGSLTIDHSTVSGNYAGSGAGVAALSGDVTIRDSTFSGNDTHEGDVGYDEYGGGLWAGAGATVTVDRSTFVDNTAGYGGAIYAKNGSANVTIENATITGNHATTGDGGGLWGAGNRSLTVTGSTVTGNDAMAYGGGLAVFGTGADFVENSIVSGNTATDHPSSADLIGSYEDQLNTSFSLIGVPNSYYLYDGVPASNQYGANPKLGPLQQNGGPTRTRAPLCGSPVIDKGKAFSLDEDQRGLDRPVGLAGYPDSTAVGADGADIGAVELQTSPGAPPCSTPPPPGPTPTPPVNPGDTGQRAAALTKCKKKHKQALAGKRKHDALTKPVKQQLAKKFKKCKRKANQLPV